MIDRTPRQNGNTAKDARREWEAPRIQSVVPTRRTRGGGGPVSANGDDAYYNS
jgi:hypothetical protein